MPQCEFRFPDGRRCKAYRATPRFNTVEANKADPEVPLYKVLCWGHAFQLKAIPQAELDAANANKRGKKLKKLREKERKQREAREVHKTLDIYFKDLIDMVDEPFDAAVIWDVLSPMNPMPQYTDGVVRYLFVLWVRTPVISRIPRTIEGFAKLTGIPERDLNAWRREPWFQEVSIIEEKNFLRTHSRIPALALLEKCAHGDMAAIKMFYDMFPVKDGANVANPFLVREKDNKDNGKGFVPKTTVAKVLSEKSEGEIAKADYSVGLKKKAAPKVSKVGKIGKKNNPLWNMFEVVKGMELVNSVPVMPDLSEEKGGKGK